MGGAVRHDGGKAQSRKLYAFMESNAARSCKVLGFELGRCRKSYLMSDLMQSAICITGCFVFDTHLCKSQR